jgi:tetratricopeptide (TPR) repeat protein
MLSKVYQELGKTDELLASQKALLEKDPDNPQLMLNVARWSVEVGDYVTARGLYEKLVVQKPDDVALQKNLALIQLRDGDTTAAASTYQEVVRLDPSDADGFIRLADLQSSGSVRNYQAAVQNIQAGLNLKPSSAHGWSVWGKILERQGSMRDDPNGRIERYRQAITKFQKAAELNDPTWSEYARREIQRQERLIEIEEAKIKKQEYEQLEEL